MSTTRFNLPLAIALCAALSASPALAQGNGKGNGNHGNRDRVEHRDREEHRDRDHDDDRRWDRDDDRRDEPRFERRTSSTQRRVPPGWCRGQGNPHNTAANCRYNRSRSQWERYDDRDRRWESRTTYERGTRNSSTRNSGSYDAAHRDFHYSHDRQCRERASQRPLDPRWQLQVRGECARVHEDFHRRWGIAHR
ncbi:hypothetical protein [Longimicrobium sp.]|uniref:hypothetical protein n=1 Tax=Longimicrobium sp. TaxID=2029185 RepID=UPI003B3A49FF